MHGYYFQARVSRIVSVRSTQFSSKVRAVAATGISDWSKVAGPFKTTMAVPEKCKDGEEGTSKVDQKWWNMMKHLAHFALSKRPSGTSIEPLQAVGRDSQTVPLSNKLRTLPVRTCMSQRMKRERRGVRCFFLSWPHWLHAILKHFLKWKVFMFCIRLVFNSARRTARDDTCIEVNKLKEICGNSVINTYLYYSPQKTVHNGFGNTVKFGGISFPYQFDLFLIWLLITGDISSSDPEVRGAVVWGHQLAMVLRVGVILLRNDRRVFSNDSISHGPHLSKLNHRFVKEQLKLKVTLWDSNSTACDWTISRQDYLMREEMGRMEVPMEEQLPMGSTIDCTVPGLHPGLQFVEPIKKHEHTCMEKHAAVDSPCP